MKAAGEWSEHTLFEGRPRSRELFHMVRRYIESLGEVTLDFAKTQVSFGAVTKFAWVWLPQMWMKKRPGESITLAFDVGRRIDDERIAEAVEPRPGRWTHHVLIDDESDLDGQVREWLHEAFVLAQERR